MISMAYSIKITQKTNKNRPKTKLISVRIPEFAYEQIEALVELGVFSSRTDFINYAIQKTLFELASINLPVSDDDLLKMMALGPESPPSENEVREVLADVEREVKAKLSSGSNRPERRRVLRVRRTNRGTSKDNATAD
ncbi:Putative transcriptional regulators containing the CopG/Arc/MetJ DNA-binding domain [Thermococcus nautili]|nr:Putative transcriptional regulators containing the CopG/Arc/MetJ DNA-binding domain [Thermococcus nautili]